MSRLHHLLVTGELPPISGKKYHRPGLLERLRRRVAMWADDQRLKAAEARKRGGEVKIRGGWRIHKTEPLPEDEIPKGGQ